jgi:hypothetical protein
MVVVYNDSVRYELNFDIFCGRVLSFKGLRILYVLWRRSLKSTKVFAMRIFLDKQNNHRTSCVFTAVLLQMMVLFGVFTLFRRGSFGYFGGMCFLCLHDDRIWFRWMLKYVILGWNVSVIQKSL